MLLRITKVDMDGFLGRENHPDTTDEGLIVSVVGLELLNTEGDPVGPDAVRELAQLETAGEDTFLRVWTVITADGRKLEMMDYEVELHQS